MHPRITSLDDRFGKPVEVGKLYFFREQKIVGIVSKDDYGHLVYISFCLNEENQPEEIVNSFHPSHSQELSQVDPEDYIRFLRQEADWLERYKKGGMSDK